MYLNIDLNIKAVRFTRTKLYQKRTPGCCTLSLHHWFSVRQRIWHLFYSTYTKAQRMLKNYLLTAWRNFWKNRTFSFINTTGLALGMTCSLLIMLWIQDERKIDSFHENKEHLYSIYERQYYDGKVTAFQIGRAHV